ncbi:receptor-type tyrosine-protein phosphatase zeta isoform X1 [Fundulus heteroclitus]|uniref:receptor-type tyrosine-protein phosphatase zeta isoform X1 n=1 Tax=Fundulus heteroclitus TaxID=8078 RepID=UPI00165B2D7E|nr:receptor-type tyrosine-protein phosphatase zeta isoform X1 [Fundulus heteroclitus]
MDLKGCWLFLAAHFILICQQAGGYTYRNQRKFSEDIDWSYAGTLNQNYWAKKFPLCSSAKQSPININENLAPVKLQYQKLKFDGWESLTTDSTTIKNDGKTVAINVDGEFYVSGGGLRSKFKVGRITFHWGRCNASSEGSEHSLEGVKYPLEMQIYCYEAHQFDSLDETIQARGRITALAVFFETTTEDNMNYAPIIDGINSVSRYGKGAEVSPFTLLGLLPNSTEKYFIYNGSLTTPPCSETVEWIVFKNKVVISDEQLEMFCEVMTMQQAGYVMLMDYLQNNYRDQQDQFMGQVFSSYTGIEEVHTPVCSSEPESIQAAPQNLSSLLVIWERPRAVYDANIEKYSITYRLANTEDSTLSEYLTDGYQDTGAILDDLLANSTYKIWVVSICSNGLRGRVSDLLTVVMPVDDPEKALDLGSDETEFEGKYESDLSWNEVHQTENNLDWSSENSPKTTTSAPPLFPLPGIRTPTEKSSERKTTTERAPALISSQSGQVVRPSEETEDSTPLQPPEDTKLTESRGSAGIGSNTLLYFTTEEPLISSFTTSFLTEADGVNKGVVPESSSEKEKGGSSTIYPEAFDTKTEGTKVIFQYPAIMTTVSSLATDQSRTSSSSSIQAETDQGFARAINEDENVSTYPRGFPEVQTSASTAQTLSSTEAVQDSATSSSMPHFSSTTPSVMKRGNVVQVTQSLSNGERSSVFSSSSFASSPLCDTLDPSAAPSTRLHDPSSLWPVSSTRAPASQHATTGLRFSKDLASTSVPFLPASTLPQLPHPSHSLSGLTTDSVYSDIRLGDSDNDVLLSGSSGDLSVLSSTPPLETVLDLAHTSVTVELSNSPWDFSSSTFSLSFSPTLQPSVVFSSDFTFSDATLDFSKSATTGFEDSRYATGSTTESLVPEIGGDGLLLASDVDIMCGCSLEASSLGLHASPNVPLASAAKSSRSLELYSSMNLLSASGVDVENRPTSLEGLASPGLYFDHSLQSHSASSHSISSPQFLQATHSDLHLSVTATLSVATNPGLSASERTTTSHTSSLTFPPTTSPFTPTPEEQVLDFSSSTSGSAFFPDSQEGVDQEWDKSQSSASGVGPVPHPTKVVSTIPPVLTLESGQSPDDVEEHSSAFYFESGSGSAIDLEAGGKATSAVSEVTSGSPWSLGGTEYSGSGQGEGLSDNETSSDFSISERTETESEEEEPVSDASNSSHESRVGSMSEKEKKAVIPLAIISTLTLLGLVVLVGIFIYWRMCFQTAHFYINSISSPRVIAQSTAGLTSDEDTAFPVKDFVEHVAELHSTQGFHSEFETMKDSYEEVQACTVNMWMTTDSSTHPDNRNKNRYNNILAYDHSRVQLSPAAKKDVKTTDYINANYVDGYKRPRSYIAAQGPLRASTEDFWRMIWEQNVHIIVMITNLVENGRRKCDQYWPAEVQEEYGQFLVTVKSTKVLACYTERTFSVMNTLTKKSSKKGCSNERTVTQYQYTQWPDMGVPELALPLLSFVRKSSRAKTDNMGPVVVHCSAGVGRTGTYIVLDSMLEQIKDEAAVNITGFLKHIRTQRNYLVQTEEQYVFIHDALVEAILCGETEVVAANLHSYVDELLTPGSSGRTRLDKQFQLVCHTEGKTGNFSAALQDNNFEKNRDCSVIPAERSRVRLSTTAGEMSDYINASYITGYRLNREFIITQNPLPGTIKDFWRMIWDHNTQVIVSLPGQTMEEAELCAFWPGNEQSISFKMFTVTQRSEANICLSNEDMLVVREYTLTAAKDDFVLEVKHFLAPCWPNPDSPISNIFELICLVNEERLDKDSPTVVHDDVGGVTAGMFCALSSLKQQLDAESSADVFQAARLTNLLRPGVFSDVEHYQFLYKAMLSVIGTQDVEKTFVFSDNGTTTDSLESLV